jgi:hypothetical protein
MNILLIVVPPTTPDHPLLGIASISSVAIAVGYSITIEDLNLATYLDGRIDHAFWECNMFDIWGDDTFLEKVWPVVSNIFINKILTDSKIRDFDVVGIHVNYASLRIASNVAEVIKQYFPYIPVVVGGPGVFMSNKNDIQWADVAFHGEAELSLQHWLTEGCLFRGVKETLQVDMSNLSVPNFSFFPKGYKQEAVLPIETSRGCVNGCTFCLDKQMWGQLRIKAPQFLARDLASARSYGASYVNCMDSIVNSTKERLLDILPIFKTSGLLWGGMLQARGINNDIAARLRDSGCKNVFLGVESFSPKLLHYFNKSHVPEDAKLAIQSLGNVGINVSIGLIIAGEPFQSKDDFFSDVDTIVSLALFLNSVAINPLCIGKNTSLYKISSDLGVQGLDTPNGWKLWYHKNSIEELSRRCEWCCIAIESFQSAGIRINEKKDNFPQFFNLNKPS